LPPLRSSRRWPYATPSPLNLTYTVIYRIVRIECIHFIMRNAAGSGIQVLDRAVGLLLELARTPRPVPLAQLAAATGLSRSTTRRVLAALEAHELCERRAPGFYALGIRLLELGSLVGDRLDLRELARPELQRLADTTNLSVFLYVPKTTAAICIDRIDGRFAHTMAIAIGGRVPFHAGAGSKAMLASFEPDELARFLADVTELPRLTDRTITSPDALKDELHLVRKRGWAMSYEEMTEGVSAIGAAIIGHANAVVGAISVSGLTPHVFNDATEELAESVVSTAAVISRKFRPRSSVDASLSVEVSPRPNQNEAAISI